jgi:hypothetical protein
MQEERMAWKCRQSPPGGALRLLQLRFHHTNGFERTHLRDYCLI